MQHPRLHAHICTLQMATHAETAWVPNRAAPEPVELENLVAAAAEQQRGEASGDGLADQVVLPVSKHAASWIATYDLLRARAAAGPLEFDKVNPRAQGPTMGHV